MKCPHRYVLYDRVWWICRHCDHYFKEQGMRTFIHDAREWGVKIAWSNFRFQLGYRIGGFTSASRRR